MIRTSDKPINLKSKSKPPRTVRSAGEKTVGDNRNKAAVILAVIAFLLGLTSAVYGLF